MALKDLGLELNQHSIHKIDVQNSTKLGVFNFEYIPAFKMAIYTVHGYFRIEEFQTIYKSLAYHTYNNRLPVICSVTDLQELEGSFHQMNEWFLSEFMPKAVAQGFKANVTILSKDFFAQLAQEDFDEMVNELFIQKHFEDYQEGYDWIINQVKSGDWDLK
jgi:hypothetical protein